MDTTIDFIGATVRVPFVGQGVINDSRRFLEGTMYAVDIPINGRNMRVWRSYEQLKVVALRVIAMPSESIKTVPNLIVTPSQDKTHEAPVITPETPDAAAHIPRDNAPLEPRPLVVVAPVLRLFTARPAVERLGMVA